MSGSMGALQFGVVTELFALLPVAPPKSRRLLLQLLRRGGLLAGRLNVVGSVALRG
jgi:hypothetical protein